MISTSDKIKLTLAILLLLAGVAVFHYLADQAAALRVAAVLVAVVAAFAVASFTDLGRQFSGFARDAVAEAKKVVWPSRKETMQTTGVVVVLVLVMAVFLWVVDAGLAWVVKNLMGWGV
ncbi:MAG: preprotein translocase subunit SecE [Sulfuricellaceae bacterium]|jgi:preprotein translocase subunit SecE